MSSEPARIDAIFVIFCPDAPLFFRSSLDLGRCRVCSPNFSQQLGAIGRTKDDVMDEEGRRWQQGAVRAPSFSEFVTFLTGVHFSKSVRFLSHIS